MGWHRLGVVVAAGSGSRMGSSLPKQFLQLGGKPVVWHSVQALLRAYPDLLCVVCLPPDHLTTWQQQVAPHFDDADLARVFPVAGGATRTQSVANGLQQALALAQTRGWVVPRPPVPPDHGGEPNPPAWQDAQLPGVLVGVHDGARPLVTPALVRRVFEAALPTRGALPAVPLKASLRELPAPQPAQQYVLTSAPADRERFRAVQTPQVFGLPHLLHVYQNRPNDHFTDDASLYQAAGHGLTLVPGEDTNLKLTTPGDLKLIQAMLAVGGVESGLAL